VSRDHDLDRGSGHTAYHCTSLIDLYLHAKFTEIYETFCGRTYVCMDGHLRLALIGRPENGNSKCLKITQGPQKWGAMTGHTSLLISVM